MNFKTKLCRWNSTISRDLCINLESNCQRMNFLHFFTPTTKKTFLGTAQASFKTNFTECTLNFFNHFSSFNKWNYKTLLSGRVEFAVCGFCVLTLPFVLLIQFRVSTRQTDRLTTRGATNWQKKCAFRLFSCAFDGKFCEWSLFSEKTVRWQLGNSDLNCSKDLSYFSRSLRKTVEFSFVSKFVFAF